jgi:hypothetical protein
MSSNGTPHEMEMWAQDQGSCFVLCASFGFSLFWASGIFHEEKSRAAGDNSKV